MIRKIIEIDENKCNGCGLCAEACHEGAIGMIDGKAKLLRDDYCDGLGDCLPVCPVDAIRFVEREAAAYDEAAVNAAKGSAPCSCPGSSSQSIQRENKTTPNNLNVESQLTNWPVQIRLSPVNAPYFDGADLLIAADCTAFAYGNFHNEFIKNRITLVGCPKLDSVDYSEKLTEIFKQNNIKSILLTRMQVPCCGGLQMAVAAALKNCGKEIPAEVVIISNDGKLL